MKSKMMFVDKYALWPHNKWNRYIHRHWLRKQRKKKIEFICKKAIPHTAHINKCKTKWPIAGPSSFFRCVCTKLINMLNSWWVLRIHNAPQRLNTCYCFVSIKSHSNTRNIKLHPTVRYSTGFIFSTQNDHCHIECGDFVIIIIYYCLLCICP